MGQCVARSAVRELVGDGTPPHPLVDKVQVMDWDDEELVIHRCAMNCLHNYALGKMKIEDRKLTGVLTKGPNTASKTPWRKSLRKVGSKLLTKNSFERKKSSQLQNISFAEDLEQICIFEIEPYLNLVESEISTKDEGVLTSESTSEGIKSLAADCKPLLLGFRFAYLRLSPT
jgi:hypothetical protein